MLTDSRKILDCFSDNYIGIKGCHDQEPESGLYWHNHPKIDIKVASKLVDGLNAATGYGLLKQYEKLAIKKVVADLQTMLSYKDFQVNSILSDKTIRKSGAKEWTGCEDNWYSATFKSRYTDDKFRTICWDSIGITVNKNITKTFHVQDDRGRREIEVDLLEGYNTVRLGIETDSCEIKVFFNPNGVKIGRKSTCSCDKYCDKCRYYDCGCGSIVTEKSVDGICFEYEPNLFGFDACIQCRCSIEKIACYYKKDLALPIFYMSGILAFEAAKLTDKTNPCFRNETEDYKYLIDLYRGSSQMVMGTKIEEKGKYQESLYSTLKSIRNQMKSMKTDCLTCTGGSISPGF